MATRRQAKDKALQEHKRLLLLVPADARTIQVCDDRGKEKYRPVNELAITDVIQTKKDGTPIYTKRKAGRKVKPYVGPANAGVAEAIERKQRALSKDAILQAIKDTPESADVLHFTMIGLAEEAGSIAFERTEAERRGKDTSPLSVRRINALKAVVDTWLRRKEQISDHTIDLEAPGFHTLFTFIMETFKQALEVSEVEPEMIKVVFARISSRVSSEDWQAEAKGRMRTSI